MMIDQHTSFKEGDRVVLAHDIPDADLWKGQTGTVTVGFAGLLCVAFDHDPDFPLISIGNNFVVNLCLPIGKES